MFILYSLKKKKKIPCHGKLIWTSQFRSEVVQNALQNALLFTAPTYTSCFLVFQSHTYTSNRQENRSILAVLPTSHPCQNIEYSLCERVHIITFRVKPVWLTNNSHLQPVYTRQLSQRVLLTTAAPCPLCKAH